MYISSNSLFIDIDLVFFYIINRAQSIIIIIIITFAIFFL